MKVLKFKNSSYNVSSIILCIQYAKPWLHSDIRSCCHRSLHAFTFRYDSTLLGYTIFYTEGVLHEILLYLAMPFFTLKVFLHEISSLL